MKQSVPVNRDAALSTSDDAASPLNIVGALRACQNVARRARRIVICVTLSAGLSTAGCAAPAARYDARALEIGLTIGEIEGSGFRHRLYAGPLAPSGRLRVYLGGDGSPWLRGRAIASDPTPRRPLELELLARDPGAAVLLGRPCYHGFAADENCTPDRWTNGRYGAAIVESLATALDALIARYPDVGVTLIGYSGGGVLARLVADRVDRVDRVITVAANLDVTAWVELHGYLALDSSLDPSVVAVPARRFDEVHLVGERDENVPPSIVESYVTTRPGARIERMPTFDHVCCWADVWPALMSRLDR